LAQKLALKPLRSGARSEVCSGRSECTMQPPQLGATILTYTPIRDQLAQLKAYAESRHQSNPCSSGVDRLACQIETWLRAMSRQQQFRKFTVDEVIMLAQLTGAYQTLPAKREVAEALRVLGFRAGRDWSNAGRNRRYWVLPE
jgi:hypothetical protein